MKDILETIILHLVENKEAVKITQTEQDEKETIFKVEVEQKDMGRVIGRQGKVAKSIRTIMKSLATKERKKVSIEFVD